MNRADFQELTRGRLREARILLREGESSGAYYLAGYIVECALKACIAKQTKRHDFLNLKAVQKAHTHDLRELVRAAGLEPSLRVELNNKAFALNWKLTTDWGVESRYEERSPKQGEDLISAITARKYGVLRWLRRHW